MKDWDTPISPKIIIFIEAVIIDGSSWGALAIPNIIPECSSQREVKSYKLPKNNTQQSELVLWTATLLGVMLCRILISFTPDTMEITLLKAQ